MASTCSRTPADGYESAQALVEALECSWMLTHTKHPQTFIKIKHNPWNSKAHGLSPKLSNAHKRSRKFTELEKHF